MYVGLITTSLQCSGGVQVWLTIADLLYLNLNHELQSYTCRIMFLLSPFFSKREQSQIQNQTFLKKN